MNENEKAVNTAAKSPHRLMTSFSEVSVEVSDLYAMGNGKLELTCLATIPAHVGIGEQFADYKTYSVRSKYWSRIIG